MQLLALVVVCVCSADADQPGPYQVGVSRWNLVDASRQDRKLTTEIWYPVDADSVKGTGVPIRDADCAEGPFPVVLFSHGNSASRVQSSYLTEHWASHGYIVVSPDHQFNTVLDSRNGDRLQSALDRPVDCTFILDEVERRASEPSGLFEGRVDRSRIGAAGHSFGGYTVLMLAGATADAYEAGKFVGRDVDRDEYRHPDARVRAVIAYAPIGPPILKPSSFPGITIPVLVFGGTNDRILPFEQHQAPIFAGLGGPCYLAAVQGGSHFCFNNAGFSELVRMVKPKSKVEELLDRDVADRLVKAASIAFLDRHLKGVDDWPEALQSVSPYLTIESRHVDVRTPESVGSQP